MLVRKERSEGSRGGQRVDRERDIPTSRQGQEGRCSVSLMKVKQHSPKYLEPTRQAQTDHIYPCAVSDSSLSPSSSVPQSQSQSVVIGARENLPQQQLMKILASPVQSTQDNNPPKMSDPKACLPQTTTTVPDTSTLGTQLSAVALSDESAEMSSPSSHYQVFLFAGFGHKYPLL